jgi:hypothetical protein
VIDPVRIAYARASVAVGRLMWGLQPFPAAAMADVADHDSSGWRADEFRLSRQRDDGSANLRRPEMSMQSFVIRLANDGVPMPPVTGRANDGAIFDAFRNIKENGGFLVIDTDELEGGFVAVQAGAIVSFVSKAEG